MSRPQFVDCRWEVGKPGRGRELYREGHIPGASFLDVETDLSGRDGPGRHPLPSAGDFALAAGRAGIGPGILAIAYDQGMTGGAARLWWLLRHFGHDAVAVLDGGITSWLGPLEAGEEDIELVVFEPRTRLGDTVEADDIAAALDDDRLLLLDARVPERYRGDVEPIDRLAGRIPGAVNWPYTRASVPPPQAREAAEIVVYCGSGITACVDLLALARSGRPDAKLYPGGWSDWSTRRLQVERG
jgi:thiosulfate/3-mercaptopyruvate sulfurtransferase